MAQAQLKSQRPARDWPFKVKPLHPVLGCEITGEIAVGVVGELGGAIERVDGLGELVQGVPLVARAVPEGARDADEAAAGVALLRYLHSPSIT